MTDKTEPTNPPTSENTNFSDEEIRKILATAKATRSERDEAAKKTAELEESNRKLQAQMEQIKAIDPKRVEELETLAAQYEERKLEEQRQFSELKERWSAEKTNLQQEIQKLVASNREIQLLNALEKAFYAAGGKTGKSNEDGYSYFDLVRDRALKYVQMDESGKLAVLDPRDGTRLRTDKGINYTPEDLMFRLRSDGPTAALFEAPGSAGSGMSPNNRPGTFGTTREQLMQIKDRAARLARARELGID